MSCEWGAACWRGRASERAMFTPPSLGPKTSPISVTVAVTTVMRIQSQKSSLWRFLILPTPRTHFIAFLSKDIRC